MTDITSNVQRRTVAEKEGGLSRKKRRIVVGLGPGNNVSVREERCDQTFYISVRELYDYLEYRDARAKLDAAPVRRVKRGVL